MPALPGSKLNVIAHRQGIAPAQRAGPMTYPQYQPPAQQGYAPQQPPQGYAQPPAQHYPVPGGTAQDWAQSQHQGHNQPPAPSSGALSAPPPPLATGGASGGGSWPKLRHLQGCTIIIEPVRVDETKTKLVNGVLQPQPEAYLHLTVVDSPTGVIQYGDSLDAAKPSPLAWERATPCRFTNVNDYGWGLVNEVRNALAAGEPARVGVIERGTQGNRPYMVTKPDKMVGGGDRPDGAERFQRAAAVWNEVWAKTFANPEPRALLAPPQQPQQQVAYGQPQQPPAQPYPAMQGVQPGFVPTPYGQAPAGAVHPEYAAAVQQPSAQIMPQQYPYGNMIQTHASMAAQYGGPPQGGPPANPAFEAYIASLAPEQQAGARAQFAAAQAQLQQQPAAPQGPGI